MRISSIKQVTSLISWEVYFILYVLNVSVGNPAFMHSFSQKASAEKVGDLSAPLGALSLVAAQMSSIY